jgi:glycosyltransferase involved in cell wall biosynthesis
MHLAEPSPRREAGPVQPVPASLPVLFGDGGKHEPWAMRVLIAHSAYRQFGGEDRYLARQVELLQTEHQVRLEVRANAELGSGPATAARMLIGLGERRSIARAIEAFRPDVVHLHNPYPALGPSVHLAVEASGTPLVQTVHNMRLRCPNGLQFTEGEPCVRCEGGRYDNAVRHRCFPSASQAAAYASTLWVHRFGLRLEDKVDTYIAISRFVERRLLEWGIPPERIALVRNITDTPDAPVPLGDRGVFLGRASAEKGGEVLLRALAVLGDPPFDLVGDGPDLGRWQRLAQQLGLTRVRFTGQLGLEAVEAVIRGARFVVVPSVCHEAASLSAIEGMAAGRPLVASEMGGLPELTADGRGRLAPAGDADALAEAMATYGNVAVAESDGARAHAFVREECGPEPHLEGLLRAYAQAATVLHHASASRVSSSGSGGGTTA